MQQTNWWNSKRLHAAELLAAQEQTDEAIAQTLNINRATLHRWKQVPEFQTKVETIQAELAAHVRANSIRSRERRLKNLEARVDKMHALIEARGAAMALTAEIEGGETGLLVKDYKGKDADRAVYKFDAALVRELREHEKQAAIEVGDWTEKRELAGKDGAPILITCVEVVKPDVA